VAANSDVEIVNMALVLLGSSPITAMDEGTKAATLASQIFDTERDATLYDFDWNFASKRLSLARDAAAPAFGFAYSFQLPPDYIRVLEVSPDRMAYKIEGRKLVCDATSVYIRYTRQVTSPSEWSPAFKAAFAARLAWRMALPLTELSSVAAQKGKEYEALLGGGRSSDSQEGGAESALGPGADVLIDTRHVYDGLSNGQWWVG
jgi:hypothetical protein